MPRPGDDDGDDDEGDGMGAAAARSQLVVPSAPSPPPPEASDDMCVRVVPEETGAERAGGTGACAWDVVGWVGFDTGGGGRLTKSNKQLWRPPVAVYDHGGVGGEGGLGCVRARGKPCVRRRPVRPVSRSVGPNAAESPTARLRPAGYFNVRQPVFQQRRGGKGLCCCCVPPRSTTTSSCVVAKAPSSSVSDLL
jgi:hypothetical protein